MRLCGGRDINDAHILQESPYKKGNTFVPEKRYAHTRGKTFRLYREKALRMFPYTVFPRACGEKCAPFGCPLWRGKQVVILARFLRA